MQYLSERLLATQSRRARGDRAHQQAVATGQRERILAATEQLVAERGCAGTSIERIAKGARVSSITFYDHFASKEEAFVAAFDRAVHETRDWLAQEAPADHPWPARIREGLRALLAAIATHPARARMCLIEAPQGAPQLVARYDAALDAVVPILCEGRQLDSAAAGLPETLEEAIAGGLAWLLRERLEAVGTDGIEEMAPRLLDVALRPYLGSAEALHLAVSSEET
jgi:AcrR family transcriptional regulator